MIALLQKAGLPGWVLLAWTLAGMVWAVGYCLWWWRERDPVGAGRRGFREALERGLSPRRQYEAGRNAALAEAATPGAAVFTGSMVIWVAVLLMAAVVVVVTTPDLGLVADILRGRYDLPEGGAAVLVEKVSRALVTGALAALFLGPAALVAGMAVGFVQGWLLGAQVDRALLAVLEMVDSAHENAAHPQLPPLRDLTRRLADPAVPPWHVSGFLLGPFWYLGHGRYGRLGRTLGVLVLLGTVGFLVWSQAPGLMGDGGGPVLGGVPLDGLWHHLREFWPALLVLPLLWRIGVKGLR